MRKDYEKEILRFYGRDLENLPLASELTAFNTAEKAVKDLVDATNVMGTEDAVVAGIISGLLSSHRYLQSQGINAILKALGEFGRMPGNKDARNSHAKGTCEQLVQVLRDRIYWPD